MAHDAIDPTPNARGPFRDFAEPAGFRVGLQIREHEVLAAQRRGQARRKTHSQSVQPGAAFADGRLRAPLKRVRPAKPHPSTACLLPTARSRGSSGGPCLQSVGAPRDGAHGAPCEIRPLARRRRASPSPYGRASPGAPNECCSSRKGVAGVSEGNSAIGKSLRAPAKANSAISFPGAGIGNAVPVVGGVGCGAAAVTFITPRTLQVVIWDFWRKKGLKMPLITG